MEKEVRQGNKFCNECGKLLVSKRTTKKFCNSSCRYKYYAKYNPEKRKISKKKWRDKQKQTKAIDPSQGDS